MLQLILKHIINSSASQWGPAAAWTVSKNSTPHHCPQENQEDRFMSVLMSVSHLTYRRTMCPLCIQASPAHLQGGRGVAKATSAWFLSDIRRCDTGGETLWGLFELVSYLLAPPPTRALIIFVSVIIMSASAWYGLPKEASVNRALHRPKPLRELVVIYPNSSCHSSPGSRLPAFSLVASLPLMTEKISMLHTESLSYNKKGVLHNKPDVNNCWKQYRVLRRRVHLMFCLAVSEEAQFHLGPKIPF